MWKDDIKMQILKDCEGVLYPDKFSKIYNTSPGRFKYLASPKIRDNPSTLICKRSTWREIKNKKILAAINALDKNNKNFIITVEGFTRKTSDIRIRQKWA
jgi:hypothetical protein